MPGNYFHIVTFHVTFESLINVKGYTLACTFELLIRINGIQLQPQHNPSVKSIFFKGRLSLTVLPRRPNYVKLYFAITLPRWKDGEAEYITHITSFISNAAESNTVWMPLETLTQPIFYIHPGIFQQNVVFVRSIFFIIYYLVT